MGTQIQSERRQPAVVGEPTPAALGSGGESVTRWVGARPRRADTCPATGPLALTPIRFSFLVTFFLPEHTFTPKLTFTHIIQCVYHPAVNVHEQLSWSDYR